MRICYSLVTLAIAIGGCGDDAKVGVSATTLDFGEVDCGTIGSPQAVVLSNSGDGSFTYTAALAAGDASPFSVTPAAGTVGATSALTLVITPKAVPVPSTSALTDTLTITTSASGDKSHTVALSLTPHGAILTVSAATVAFAGNQKVGVATTLPLTITNTGNADTTVTAASLDESFAVDETAAPLAAGAQLDRTVTLLPLASGALSAEIAISATGPICAAIPKVTATATGTFGGTAADVTLVGSPAFRLNTTTTCVRLMTGYVACLGLNSVGLRGAGSTNPPVDVPTLVRKADGTPLDGVVKVAAMRGQACARRSDSSLWCWGNVGGFAWKSASGQSFATQVATGVTDFDVGYGMICPLIGGTVTCTGRSASQNNSGINLSSWTASGVGITAAACGGYALQADGTVKSFGLSANGVRGNADADNAPASLVLDSVGATFGATNPVVQIAARLGRASGSTNQCGGACTVMTDGTVWCWGASAHGENGDNTTNQRSRPVKVVLADGTTPLSGATKLAASRNHVCAIATGGVFCWGRNDEGELGNANLTSTPVATPLDTQITNAVAIAANARGTCVVRSDGGMTCFGLTASSTSAPVDVAAFAP